MALVPRNWKQTLTIFWLLPAWSSELETGMSHFFGVARVEFPGSASTCPGQVRRNFRQWSTGQLEKFFAEVVGLDDLDIFFPGKNPDLGLGLRCRAGAAGRLCRAGMWRLALGELVLIGRATHWASPFSLGEPVLGEPSNEVGASHQTRLGRAIKRGWASQY